jgi:hypothetical protein
MNTFGLYPRPVLDAAQALFRALGSPTRTTWQQTEMNTIHPVFGLAEHFEGHDNYDATGYTENQYRGDHLSVPCWTENNEIFVLETSFHKGEMFVERVEFPTAPEHVYDALLKLLHDCETR